MNEFKWYALKVTANKEKKVKEQIEKEVKINNFEKWIPQIIIPSEKILSYRNGKKYMREKTTLPGYVLISIDFSNGEILPFLEKVKGVYGFLSTPESGKDKEPIPLRDSEMARYLNKKEESIEELQYNYYIGDKVKINEGPFSTFEGVVSSLEDAKKKMIVDVSIFNRTTPVELEYGHVDKV